MSSQSDIFLCHFHVKAASKPPGGRNLAVKGVSMSSMSETTDTLAHMEGLKAWVTIRRVHKTPDCPYLARSKAKEVPVAEIGVKAPCRQCFPHLKDLDLFQRSICEECNPREPRPCRHNGGVQVRIWRSGDLNGANGTIYWVWGPRALFSDVVGSSVF